MIKISNERELLPVVRNLFANWDATEKLLLPLFNSFVDSELSIDSYNGWAFSMKFVKNSVLEYQHVVSAMDMSKSKELHDWFYAPSKKDRNDGIWICNNTAIVIHQES